MSCLGPRLCLPLTFSSACDHPVCATATGLLTCFLFDLREEEGPEFYSLVLKIHFLLFKTLDPVRWNPCILGVDNKGKSVK